MGDNYNMANSNTVDSKCSSKVDESISLPSALLVLLANGACSHIIFPRLSALIKSVPAFVIFLRNLLSQLRLPRYIRASLC